MVGRKQIFNLDIIALPILQLLIKRHDLLRKLIEFRETVETVELQLKDIEERVEIFGSLGKGHHIWLGGKPHFVGFEVSVVLILVDLECLVHHYE
jgi:hypothetical protein